MKAEYFTVGIILGAFGMLLLAKNDPQDVYVPVEHSEQIQGLCDPRGGSVGFVFEGKAQSGPNPLTRSSVICQDGEIFSHEALNVKVPKKAWDL